MNPNSAQKKFSTRSIRRAQEKIERAESLARHKALKGKIAVEVPDDLAAVLPVGTEFTVGRFKAIFKVVE
jgi:hypothetical protein